MRKTTLSLVLFQILFSCKPTYTIQKSEQKEYVLSDTTNTAIDSSIYSYIAPYKEKMEKEMKVDLAESEFIMERGMPEGRLGDFVADACMFESNKLYYPTDNKPIDLAIFNNGGLRRPLGKGKITKQDVFELMPFENELVVLTIDGNHVKKIFNFIASKDGAPVSGVRFQIKDKQAIQISINNNPLDTAINYKVLTSDYLANGGDGFDLFKDAPRENVNLKMRDALLQYLDNAGRKGKMISVNLDGRISYAK